MNEPEDDWIWKALGFIVVTWACGAVITVVVCEYYG